MSDYDEMSLEELKELKDKREAEKLAADFKAADEEKVNKEKEEYDNSIRDKAIESYLKENPPKDKLPTTSQNTKVEGYDSKKWLDEFITDPEFGTDQLHTYAECGGDCNGGDTSDCASHDPDAWGKADVFVKGIWHAYMTRENLAQFAVKGIDVKAGDGLKVQVRTMAKFGSSGIQEKSACSCLDCGTSAMNVFSLTIKQFGMKTEICAFEEYETRHEKEMIKSMGFAWGEFIDGLIYATLIDDASYQGVTIKNCEQSKSRHSIVLDSQISIGTADDLESTCCSRTGQEALYKAVIDLIADMQEDEYNPTVLILSPSIAAFFKYSSAVSLPRYMDGQVVVKNGQLVKIGSINVIETSVANKLADIDTDDVVAVMIDPRRAFGIAFGKRPSIEKDKNIDCNSTTIAQWAYFGVEVLDCEAIGIIKEGNP
jgi:hypothetical protein